MFSVVWYLESLFAKVPLQTVQSHSFIETEGPARRERVEENEKDKAKVRQRLI